MTGRAVDGAIVALDRVTVRFNAGQRNEFAAIEEADLSIVAGEVVGIVGPSGGGKSTLLSVAALLRRPSSGEVYLRGAPVSSLTTSQVTAARGDLFGLVTQRGDLLPHWTAAENVLFTARACGRSVQRGEVTDLLSDLGLDIRVQRSLPSMLSGGERQRVAIARALIGRPSLVFADEPTSALDSATAGGVIDLLVAARQPDTSIVLVTHDESLVQRLGARVVRVKDGTVSA